MMVALFLAGRGLGHALVVVRTSAELCPLKFPGVRVVRIMPSESHRRGVGGETQAAYRCYIWAADMNSAEE